MNYLVSGTAPRRMGNAHPNIVPYQDFPTADGDMILAIGNDGQFARFCAIAGHPEWADDARFATNAARVAQRKELIPLLRQATVMRTTAEWIAALEAAAVPCGPINDLAAVFAGCTTEVVYLHNPADKHETHIAVLARCLEALRVMGKC